MIVRREDFTRLGAAAALGGAIALAACGRLAGIDEYRVTETPASADSGGGQCGGFAVAEPCGGCARKNCCLEAEACEKDADCAKAQNCRSTCPLDDVECRARCYSGVSKTAAIRRYESCVLSKCADECSRCGDIGVYFGPECALCESDPAKGCPQGTACLADPECRGFLACTVERCATFDTDPACRISCAAEHPGARELFLAWALTPVEACDSACRWGRIGTVPILLRPRPTGRQKCTYT